MFRRSLHMLTIFFAVACVINIARPSVAALDDITPGASALSGFQKPALLLVKREKREGRRSRRGKRKRDPDGATTSPEPCTACEELDGFVSPSEIPDVIRKMVGKTRGDKAKAVAIQEARGVIETGLEPGFIGGADCPEIDSETWAIDYSHKRPGAARHKGIDIPQPNGTPIRAVSAGTVVGKFMNEGNRKGIEVTLRHSPEQTGLPYWTYSQYTHLREMSPLAIGARVEMGDEIGKTSNTGLMGRRIRRDALHLAILYTENPEWSNDGRFVTPKESYWMDPNAFYKLKGPYDSPSLAALPDDQKKVSTPYMKANGSFVPADTKRVWPYPCE